MEADQLYKGERKGKRGGAGGAGARRGENCMETREVELAEDEIAERGVVCPERPIVNTVTERERTRFLFYRYPVPGVRGRERVVGSQSGAECPSSDPAPVVCHLLVDARFGCCFLDVV